MSEQHPLPTPGRFSLQELQITAAWNLQGDASDAAFTDQIHHSFGLERLPEANGTARAGPITAFWLGPQSWLLLTGVAPPGGAQPGPFNALRDSMNAAGGSLFDVAASRVGWRLHGAPATTILASACPLDLHPRSFPPGTCAQSMFGHVAALYYRDRQGDFSILVARSLARDVLKALCAGGRAYVQEDVAPEPFG